MYKQINELKLQTKYWSRAKFAASILQVVPFLKMIGVHGSLAQGVITKKSDIDFLLVSEKNRIWTVRALSIFLMKILGIKTGKNKKAKRICLNRFITANNLIIFPQDKPHAKNYIKIVSLYSNTYFKQFIKANNWMVKYYKFPKINHEHLIKQNIIFKFVKNSAEIILSSKLGNWIEKLFKNYQIKRIKLHPYTKRKQGLIIANDDMVCFHAESHIYLRKFD